MSGRLAHNVFFKLKDRSPAKVEELVAACKKYLNVQPGIVFFAAGTLVPDLDRDVNDRDWDVAVRLVFRHEGARDVSGDAAAHSRFHLDVTAQWCGARVCGCWV